MSLMEERAQEYLVDTRGEGGLVCELDRSPMIDQPMIIIGLGGTGIDAMLNAKYVIQRKIKAPEGKKHPGRIAFLAVDTDETAFKEKRVGDVRVEPSEQVLINEPNLASFMKNPNLIPHPYMKDWLCKGINAGAIKYGAGGIRQCGRFMLIDKAGVFIQKLTQAANEVWGAKMENGADFPEETKYNVYLLTGIGGGTGSGTFLDAAYLIREIIERHVSVKKPVQLRGFIFMPDVNLCKVKDDAAKGYIPVNGYAALRELDFWMNSNRGRNFRQQYTPFVSIDTAETPFDLCFFVSPNGALEADYANCMQTTGEALMNIITEAEPAAGGIPFNFESYVTNLVAMLSSKQLERTYSANYIYCSMGMDEQRLQLDSIANYLAYYLLQKVDELFELEPAEHEIESLFTKQLRLDSKRGLQRLFDKTIPAQPFNEVVRTYDDYVSAIAGYKKNDMLYGDVANDELSLWVKQCQVTYARALHDTLKACMEQLKFELEKKFTDLSYGPYYVHRLLHNVDTGKTDILKRLKEEKDAIFAFLTTAEDRADSLKKQADKALKSAQQNHLVPLVSASSYKAYTEAIFKYYDHLRYVEFAKVATQFYTYMLDEVTKYNNQVVERFAELLRNLTEVFKRNSDIITGVAVKGATHTWYVGNFSQTRKAVDVAIANLEHSGDSKKLVEEFLQMMLDKRDAWVGDEGGLGESFSGFVSEKFKALMMLSLEEAYKQAENLTSDAQLIEHITEKVLPRLKSGAQVLYTPDSQLSELSNSAARAMIAVPSMATNIYSAVVNYVASLNFGVDVISSKRQGSLFWFQSSFGLPLYAHNSLISYQKSHDVHGAVDHHLGRYLKMGEKENWMELLPPLMPEATWEYAQYENKKWAARNEATRKMFHEAWEAGLVLNIAPGNPARVLGRVDRDAYDKLVASAPIGDVDRAKLLAEDAKAAANLQMDAAKVQAFVKKAKAFLASGWQPSPGEQFMMDSFNLLCNGQHVTSDDVDPNKRMEEILAENLLWTPDLAMKLNEQLKLKLNLETIVHAHEVYLKLGALAQKELQEFADALFYGVYRPTAPKVFQADVTDVNVPSFMLMTIPEYRLAPVADPFYAMFLKYQMLDEDKKEIIRKTCEVRMAKMNNEMSAGKTERYNAYVKTVTGIDAMMKKRLDAIDMDVTFNHPEIRQFYVDMRKSFALFLPN